MMPKICKRNLTKRKRKVNKRSGILNKKLDPSNKNKILRSEI